MKIEREVYDDLLTLAEAGMASTATQKLLDECRARHPEWAAARPEAELPRVEAPALLEREALVRTQRLLSQRSWLMFAGIALCMAPMIVVFTDRIRFLLYRDQPVIAAMLYGFGIVAWTLFMWTNQRLRMAGLARRADKKIRWGTALAAMAILAPAVLMFSSGTGHRAPLGSLAAIALAGIAAAAWSRRSE